MMACQKNLREDLKVFPIIKAETICTTVLDFNLKDKINTQGHILIKRNDQTNKYEKQIFKKKSKLYKYCPLPLSVG